MHRIDEALCCLYASEHTNPTTSEVKSCSNLGCLHPQGSKRSTVMPEQNHPTYGCQNRRLCPTVLHCQVVDNYVGDHWAAQRNRQGNVAPNQKQRSADDLHRTRKPHIVLTDQRA